MRRLLLVGLVCALVLPFQVAAQTPGSAGNQTTVFGPGLSLLGSGEAGKVSIVATGPRRTNVIPVAVRNNTDKRVSEISISVSARDASGSLLGAGDGDVTPYDLAPGEVAIGYAVMDGDIPEDASFEFKVQSSDAPGTLSNYFIALDVIEASYFGDRIVGTWSNPSKETVGGVWGHVICLGSDGTITGVGNANPDGDVEPSGTIDFQFNSVYGSGGLGECESFVVAGYGHPNHN